MLRGLRYPGTATRRVLGAFALLVAFQTLLAIYALSVQAQSVGIVVSKVVATVTEAGGSDSFTVTLGAQPATAVTGTTVRCSQSDTQPVNLHRLFLEAPR